MKLSKSSKVLAVSFSAVAIFFAGYFASHLSMNSQDGDYGIYLQEGKDYLRQGEFERAQEAFNQALDTHPKDADDALMGIKASLIHARTLAEAATRSTLKE